jgi:FdhE protein
MSSGAGLEPDPSIIGNTAKPPFVQLPNSQRVLSKRAERLRALAPVHDLEGYLRFLAGLAEAQIGILENLPEPAIPPLDRNAFAPAPAFDATLERLLSNVGAIEMPALARAELLGVGAADAESRALGRDLLMRDTDLRRGSFIPFALGY